MKCVRQLMFTLVVAGLCGTGMAQAQTTAADADPWSVQFDVAATFGHKSSGSLGGELGYNLNDQWQLFLESGGMRNVGTSELDARAKKVADAIGATADMQEKAVYFDAGLRYNLLPSGGWQPFVALGFGFARVNVVPSFSKDGTDITDSLGSAYGVQLGRDLNGYTTKPFLMVGGGVTLPFHDRWFGEGSYRYGRIFPRTGTIQDDTGVNTQRLQAGVGIRF